MKKLSLAMAVAATLAAGSASAAVVAENAMGLLVPHAVHNGATDTTAVGLISRTAGTVYWTFFDVDSNHVTDGQFPMTANDLYSFVWANQAGVGLEGVDGYLVFALDVNADGSLDSTDSDMLAGNAFQVNTAASDVAFVPVLPLTYLDFQNSSVDDLTAMDAYSLEDVDAAGSWEGDRIDMRYFIDGNAGGTDTAILVWTAADATNLTGYTVNIYDDAQNRKSVNFILPNAELNVFDPESIVGRPTNFKDGFIAWTVPDFGDYNDQPLVYESVVFSYSVIDAPAFGAVQTMLATTDGDVFL